MRSLSDVVRFFVVVPPVSRMMTATFAVVVVIDAALLLIEPGIGPRAMAPVLLLQAFAAASGFTVPARRGHYDLLLTRGHRRAVVAAVHYAMASAPGLVSWVALSVVEIAATPASHAALPTFGTVAALFVVSSVTWALTAPLPRFAGAVGWLLLLTLASMLPLDTVRLAVAGVPAEHWGWDALRSLVAPHTIVGVRADDAAAVPVSAAVAVAAVWLAVAIRRIEREDFRLDAGQ